MVRAVNKLISMSKKIIFSSLFLFLFSFLAFFSINSCSALTPDPMTGLNQTAARTPLDQSVGSDANFFQTFAGKLIGVVLSFVGVLFLILMIYAGITWMTAQGNDQQVTKAKDLLINSIIGLIIIFAAYAITVFVGKFVSGT